MAVRFQDQLGESLRGFPGLYTYHPPDGMRSAYKPSDWICCYQGTYVLVEAKQCRGPWWPFKEWQPQQRHFCETVINAGGFYKLVINWRKDVGVSTAESYGGVLDGRRALELFQTKTGLYQADVPDQLAWLGHSHGGWDVQLIFQGVPTLALSPMS